MKLLQGKVLRRHAQKDEGQKRDYKGQNQIKGNQDVLQGTIPDVGIDQADAVPASPELIDIDGIISLSRIQIKLSQTVLKNSAGCSPAERVGFFEIVSAQLRFVRMGNDDTACIQYERLTATGGGRNLLDNPLDRVETDIHRDHAFPVAEERGNRHHDGVGLQVKVRLDKGDLLTGIARLDIPRPLGRDKIFIRNPARTIKIFSVDPSVQARAARVQRSADVRGFLCEIVFNFAVFRPGPKHLVHNVTDDRDDIDACQQALVIFHRRFFGIQFSLLPEHRFFLGVEAAPDINSHQNGDQEHKKRHGYRLAADMPQGIFQLSDLIFHRDPRRVASDKRLYYRIKKATRPKTVYLG